MPACLRQAISSSSIGAPTRSIPSHEEPTRRRRSCRSARSKAASSVPPHLIPRPTALRRRRRSGRQAAPPVLLSDRAPSSGGFTLPGTACRRSRLATCPQRRRHARIHRRDDPHQPAGTRRAGDGVPAEPAPLRTFGELRATGQEKDPAVHRGAECRRHAAEPKGRLLLRLPLGRADVPQVRRGGNARLRAPHRGRRDGPYVGRMPTTWPRAARGGTEIPIVPALVRTGGGRSRRQSVDLADRALSPTSTIASGDKRRTLQFRAAGIIAPTTFSSRAIAV